jgi:hypothetical protein
MACHEQAKRVEWRKGRDSRPVFANSLGNMNAKFLGFNTILNYSATTPLLIATLCLLTLLLTVRCYDWRC